MKFSPKKLSKIQKIGKKFNLRYIIIHGSYARSQEKPGSDLDVAIYGNKLIDFETQLNIHSELASILGDNRERELDLKTLHQKDPLFRYEVTKDGVLIYGDKTDYDNYKCYAFRSLQDSQDLFDLKEKMIRKRLRHLTSQ